MNKKQKIIQIVAQHAADGVAACVKLYNEERTLQKVHVNIPLEALKINRVTEPTRALVFQVLYSRGYRNVHYDTLTQTFRGFVTFAHAVSTPEDLPLKPITLNSPPLRTAMGNVYRHRPQVN